MALSITALVKKYLKDNGITQAYLAEALKESPQNLANKLRKNDLDTDYVRRISLALQHDFFYELGLQLRPDILKYSSQQPAEIASIQDGNVPYYVRQEQYIQILEENIRLHRELRRAQEK